jgi:hypothetical protein
VYAFRLLHHLLVDVQAPGRIDDDDVRATASSLGNGLPCDARSRLAGDWA